MCGVRVNVRAASIGINLELSRGSLSIVSVVTLVAENASSSHVSLPKPFASGNISEWFTRFDICSDANEWDDDKKHREKFRIP